MKRVTARRAVTIIERVSYIGGLWPGILFLAAIVILITLEVILRYVFSTSTLLADEYSAYFFVGLLYFGASYTLREGRHIRITAITVRVRTKLRHLFYRGWTWINLPVVCLLAWRGWHYVIESYRLETVSATVVTTPMWIPRLLVALGLTVMALQAVAEVIKLFVVPEETEERA
jgi:TRAP-type C4-dicarboxylate transport system permease small subunit